MKKTTFDVELSDKPGRDGLYRVRVRIYQPGEAPARTTSAIAIQLRDWNTKKKPGYWIRSSNPGHAKINKEIALFLSNIREQVESWQRLQPDITPRQCSDRFRALAKLPAGQRSLGGPALLDEMRRIIEERMSEGQISPFTGSIQQTYVSILGNYLQTRPEGAQLTEDQLTTSLLLDFRRWLSSSNSPVSINSTLSGLRSAWNSLMISRGMSRNLILTSSPFIGLERLKTETKQIHRLGEADLEGLKMTPWVLFKKSGVPEARAWAKWCYLASYYQAGMRIGDLLRTRYDWYECNEQGQPVRLNYQMMKSGKWIQIPLSKQAREHLAVIWKPDHQPADYLLPFLDSRAPYAAYRDREQMRKMPAELSRTLTQAIRNRTAYLNQTLHQIGWEELGLPETVHLKMHSARHSLADRLRVRMKTDKRIGPTDARDLLGHSAFSITERYFEQLDQEGLDSAASAVYE